MNQPICIDLFAGLFGWSEGFLAEGYHCICFDIEARRNPYREGIKNLDMVIQDVLTLHGSQFKNATVIVASPPCQAYSYRAMPWKRAKALPPPDNTLFNACFRIQLEASNAAERHIPLIVENVRGAQKWTRPASGRYGSFYLWGDVPALIPSAHHRKSVEGLLRNDFYGSDGGPLPIRGSDSVSGGIYHDGGAAKAPAVFRGMGESFGWSRSSPLRNNNSKSPGRKAASAQIAKIPFPLANYIARCYKPEATT